MRSSADLAVEFITTVWRWSLPNNVSNVEIIRLGDAGLTIPVGRYMELRDALRTEAPEVSIFDDHWPSAFMWLKTMRQGNEVVNGVIHVGLIWWNGEGSGSSIPVLKEVLKAFDGAADIVLTMENGGLLGLRVSNGRVSEHEVVRELGRMVAP